MADTYNPRHLLFQALNELDKEVGEVPGLGSRNTRLEAVRLVVNSLFPKPAPMSEHDRIEATAFALYQVHVLMEEDWDENDPITEDMWMTYLIEEEREKFRARARQIIQITEGTR